jgi:hypothetical protein
VPDLSMILKQLLVEEGNGLDQCTLSNVEDGSMITRYGIIEIVQLVPDRVNSHTYTSKAFGEVWLGLWHKIFAIVSKISIMLRMIRKFASETSRPSKVTRKHTHGKISEVVQPRNEHKMWNTRKRSC